MRMLASIACLLILTGSNLHPVTPPSAPGVLAPAGAAVVAAGQAAVSADTARVEQRSKVAASLEVIDRQNTAAPDSPQKPIIAAEAKLAKEVNGNVEPAAKDRAAALEREALLAAGRLEEARKKYDEASAKADQLGARIAALETQRDEAIARARSEIDAAEAKLAEIQRQHEIDMAELDRKHAAEIVRLQEEARNQVRKAQVDWCNRIGAGAAGLAVLSFGLAVAFGGIAGIRAVGPFAAILGIASLIAFGLAQIVGQWWFMWAILVVVVAGLVLCVWWIFKKHKEGNLKQAAEEKAAKLSSVMHDVVPVLDHAYDEGKATLESLTKMGIHTVSDLMDSLIFEPLSKKMADDPGKKAAIHELRAEAKASE